MKLPIVGFRKTIVETVFQNRVTIITGEPGSGKTTQVPQFLYKEGFARRGIIVITEPRQLAAVSSAFFVAKELGELVGETVGYRIRFDDASNQHRTKLKFVTDGILLKELQIDSSLEKYSVVIVDEAHERSENIDLLLGLLKNLLTRRKDLKLIVMSATIDEQKFSRYFWNAPVVTILGKIFPVETVWSRHSIAQEHMTEMTVGTIAAIHRQGRTGDVLAFMTGEEEIREVVEGVNLLGFKDVVALPLYAALPYENQREVFEDYPGKRKVVIATNIAETSITINGIAYVIDSGLVKQSVFHPESSIQHLEVVKHSQAGCDQRKGRAGRNQHGTCYRLYTKDDFAERQRFTEPEIRRVSLAKTVLTMKDSGIENVLEFDFIDPPEQQAFVQAYETLIFLGAIHGTKKQLTETGKAMARLPLEPHIARMLLHAAKHGCTREVATIAAFSPTRNIFIRPRGKEAKADQAHEPFKDTTSDALTLLRIWKAYAASGLSELWCSQNFVNRKSLDEASKVRTQLLDILTESGVPVTEASNEETVAKAISAGLAYNLFEHESRGRYAGVFRETSKAVIHPGSSLFEQSRARWIVAADIVKTSKVWLKGCTIIKPEWLPEIAPTIFTTDEEKLLAYTPAENHALLSQTILCLGEPVAQVEVRTDLATAWHVQKKYCETLLKKGLVPLRFKPQGEGFARRWFGKHNGIEHIAWSGVEEEGKLYYCTRETFLGKTYATPVFKPFDLPAP